MDFLMSEDSELCLDAAHCFETVKGNKERLQNAVCRFKSISSKWFYDAVGANLEQIIGKPCNKQTALLGMNLLSKQLSDLFSDQEYVIEPRIVNANEIEYRVYFTLEEPSKTESYTIKITLDLVQGVHIQYGWEPRNTRR